MYLCVLGGFKCSLHTQMWRRMQHTISHTDVGTGDASVRMIPEDTVLTLPSSPRISTTEIKKTKVKQKIIWKILGLDKGQNCSIMLNKDIFHFCCNCNYYIIDITDMNTVKHQLFF